MDGEDKLESGQIFKNSFCKLDRQCQESATGGRGEIEVAYWTSCWQTVF